MRASMIADCRSLRIFSFLSPHITNLVSSPKIRCSPSRIHYCRIVLSTIEAVPSVTIANRGRHMRISVAVVNEGHCPNPTVYLSLAVPCGVCCGPLVGCWAAVVHLRDAALSVKAGPTT
jgi:hypothetical protein